jgi:NAD(P)-dependent dehydrogenase (short-subunit alcohol dehydrogenase family)
MLLADKVVLITGATAGIGRATALDAAREGAKLMLTGRDRGRGETVLADVRNMGAEAELTVADVTSAAEPDAIVAATVQRFGRIDGLVNNAGILYRGSVTDCTDEEWERTLATNVTAVFRVSRAAIRAMRPRRQGAIVNIASDWALVGAVNAVAYGTSKGAVAQLTRSMAVDHAREGIRVNAVCPGDTDTAMLASGALAGEDHAAHMARLGAAILLGRVGRPEEVGRLVVFLLSDRAAFMTGALVPIDGGNSAQ